MTDRRTSISVFLFVVALVLYPPCMSILFEGVLGAVRYFAADAFYYLAIAARSGEAGFYTFDGTHATNGFHPLWQYLLAWGFETFDLAPPQQILFVAGLGIALVALGTGLFSLALLAATRRPALAILGAVPGVYPFLTTFIGGGHGTQWSHANGMETPLSVFCFGLLAYLSLSRRVFDALTVPALFGLSCLLSVMTLCRLDDVFVFVPFLLFVAAIRGGEGGRLRRILVVCVPPTLGLGSYLLFNLSYAESVLPSSGGAKAQPLWALARNVYSVLITVAPFADPLGRAYRNWPGEAWRVVQMLLPALAAAAWLLGTRFRRSLGAESRDHAERVIGLFAVYVIVKAAYNFAIVGLWHQGQWYYPVSLMIFNMIVVVAIARGLDAAASNRAAHEAETPLARLEARHPFLGRLPIASLAVGLLVLVSANGFVESKRLGRYQSRNFEFWQEREETERWLAASCPGCGVVSFDDGIVAFSLPRTPVVNGIGLVLDAEGARALASGSLLQLAWQRGAPLLVSVNYAMPAEAYADDRALRDHLIQNAHFAREDLEAWQFEIAFKTNISGTTFIRFSPVDG